MKAPQLTYIRREKPGDVAAVRALLEEAFGQPDEAALVDALRARGAARLSMVAERGGRILGHILFSIVTIGEGDASFDALGLGPMAVAPACQRQGIGSQLVAAGFKECQMAGYEVVVVLGHPEYYPRLGFVPAGPLGIGCEFEVPEEAFMVAELRPGALAGRRGIVRYQPEFSAF